MKRITDFIVKRRNIILAIFVLLAGASTVLMQKVKINYDMTEYLPETSEVKAGLKIMEDEFPSGDECSMTVMLEGLDATAKAETRDYLAGLENVETVDYDESEKYNREDYARYDLTLNVKSDSEEAAAVYDEIKGHFAPKELTIGGEVTGEVLPLWIVALAVGCALIILIIMSESYVEPFLFMATILIAVLLNKGTNIIFPSVSNITDSITAILQLALSMDYSIMLMNRYQQERKHTPDRVEAMKAALFNAFKSISSSSITTVVGLLALVFMSFGIGKDMGFVLAKGVLFSLIAIFTCLPGLILLCDKWIEKTKKKCPSVKLDFLGKAADKGRYVAVGLFVAAFGVSYLLQSNLGIFYIDAADEKITEVFGNDNEMAVVYKNVNEAKVAEKCREIEGEKLEKVLCYGNTIGEELTAEKLPEKMDELGVETEIEDYILKLAYYHYHRQGETGRMSLAEFTRFIEEEIYMQPELGAQVDTVTRANIARLENFATAEAVLTARESDDLAAVLEVSPETVHDLTVYYNSRGITSQMTLEELTAFLRDYVAVDAKYGESIDAAAQAKLAQLGMFVNRSWIQAKLQAPEMAAAFGVDAEMVDALYNYHSYLEAMKMIAAQPELKPKLPEILAEKAKAPALSLSPLEFVGFVLEHQADEQLAGKLSPAMIQQLEFVSRLMQDSLDGRGYSAGEAAEILGMDTAKVELIYSLYELDYQGKEIFLSLDEFVSFLLNDVMNNSEYSANFDQAMRIKLAAVRNIMNLSLMDARYSVAELVDTLAPLAEVDENLVRVLYLFHGSIYDYDAGWQMSIEQLVKHLDEKLLSEECFAELIDVEMRDDVRAAKDKVAEAKELLVGDEYSRIVLETSYADETEETFGFLADLREKVGAATEEFYVVGDSAMAKEMSESFGGEMNMITVITMIFIFIVVALTFGSLILPMTLVLLIQCAVYMTMGILSLGGIDTYFIALLIVQSVLMGATIDYAILYTSYYIEARERKQRKAAVCEAYNKSIHAIATSSSILILATLVVGSCTSGVTSMILNTISAGTVCATVLILILLPALLAAMDKIIMRKKVHA